MTIGKDTVYEAWRNLENGMAAYAIGDEGMGIVSSRTAERLKSALEGFKAQKAVADIARSTKLSDKRILRLRTWWEELVETEEGSNGLNHDWLLQERHKLHLRDLEKAYMSFKDYMEKVEGGIPDDLLNRWEPVHMDLIYSKDLLTHLAGTELGEAIEQAIKDGPREVRRVAASAAVNLIREDLAIHLIPGKCDHCPL